jgi:hypothetical protein
MHNLLNLKNEFGTPYLRVFRTCKYTIRKLENIQCDKKNPEVPDSKGVDHAISYGIVSELYEYNHSKEQADSVEPMKTKGTGYTFDPFTRGSYYNPITRERY